MSRLTDRQAEIFQFILNYYQSNSLVPDYPEVMNRFGLKHANSVYQYFDALVQKCYLEKKDHGRYDIHPNKIHLLEKNDFKNLSIPILGRISASGMSEAFEEKLGDIPIQISSSKSYMIFALKVNGPSMTELNIEDGDYVLLEQRNFLKEGEVGAILYNGETSLKIFHQKKSHIELEPANERFDTIKISPGQFENVQVIGKYFGKARKEEDGWHVFLKT